MTSEGNGLTSNGGVFIPKSVSSVKPNKFFCTVCAKERAADGDDPLGWPDDQVSKYEAHVAKCAAAHEEQLRALSPKEQAPGIFGDEGWDTELERWVRKNRKPLLEDRKKM